MKYTSIRFYENACLQGAEHIFVSSLLLSYGEEEVPHPVGFPHCSISHTFCVCLD